MPVVALAPDDHVFEKMIGNVQEAKARGGAVIANHHRRRRTHDPGARPEERRADRDAAHVRTADADYHDDPAAAASRITSPVRRGCDVDQPRNLAKSVTVE
jgi:glucosamine--fructose-6-phosphate aminotransferase (isomerizing)